MRPSTRVESTAGSRRRVGAGLALLLLVFRLPDRHKRAGAEDEWEHEHEHAWELA